MNIDDNPFGFEAANTLTPEMILDYYVDDFNYSRFIQSRRNIFVVGERGSGKTMALLYNSWEIQRLRAERNGESSSLSTIGIYIPCNTPLTHKVEYQLLVDGYRASAISEHFLVLSMVYNFVNTVSTIPGIIEGVDQAYIRTELEFILGDKLPETSNLFESILSFVQREILETQRTLNSKDKQAFYENTFSFSSVFIPVLNLFCRKISLLESSHFLLLIDDAHILNDHQVQALNSWIAYRDHSRFSFKVGLAKVGVQSKRTSSGGAILEGHDYTRIDLEGAFLNKHSKFFELARKLVARRLEKMGISSTPEEFFPVSQAMKKDLDQAEELVRQEAIEKFGQSQKNQKARTDHIYKYKRARYFQTRHRKANRPPYSGFELIVFLSTGVVRNLLEPCFWMVDRVASENEASVDRPYDKIQAVPSDVQSEIIRERSERVWERLENEIAQEVDGCSTEDGKRAYRLMDALAVHFRERLFQNLSEPCAISFTISRRDQSSMTDLERLIGILQKAQILYIRSGSAKDSGRRETYYVPNRLLWPARGLDPQGQHARVSLPADLLWQAAETGQIDRRVDQEDDGQIVQEGLWDAER